MKYIEYINEHIRKEAASRDRLVIFGQNINAGSFLGGLTKGIVVNRTGAIINSVNSENSLVGFGFGIMMAGGSAVFFMKQLDFLLLGIDQLVDTYNIARNYGEYKGSFTIVPVVIDGGFQGPQSSLNNLGDFCSIARIPGYAITNRSDAESILSSKMVSPGFRIIAVSQRLLKEELITPARVVYKDDELKIFQYKEGAAATIVSFNFSFPYSWGLAAAFEENGLDPALFNVNYSTPVDWTPILASVKRTKKLIVIDDSKSENLSCYSLVAEAEKISGAKSKIIKRETGDDWLNPGADAMNIDYEKIVKEMNSNG